MNNTQSINNNINTEEPSHLKNMTMNKLQQIKEISNNAQLQQVNTKRKTTAQNNSINVEVSRFSSTTKKQPQNQVINHSNKIQQHQANETSSSFSPLRNQTSQKNQQTFAISSNEAYQQKLKQNHKRSATTQQQLQTQQNQFLNPAQISNLSTDEIIQLAREGKLINQQQIYEQPQQKDDSYSEQQSMQSMKNVTPPSINYQNLSNISINLDQSTQQYQQQQQQQKQQEGLLPINSLHYQQQQKSTLNKNSNTNNNNNNNNRIYQQIINQVEKPTETYEKLIESKVFSFLNGFFGKQKLNQGSGEGGNYHVQDSILFNKDHLMNMNGSNNQHMNYSRNSQLGSQSHSTGEVKDFAQSMRQVLQNQQQYSSTMNSLGGVTGFQNKEGTSPRIDLDQQRFSHQKQQRSMSPNIMSNQIPVKVGGEDYSPSYRQNMKPIYQGNLSNTDDINEIKFTTQSLTNEMRKMKKVIEDLQFSLNEKDAEIIKLNMHLGDEKKKLQTLVKENSLSLNAGLGVLVGNNSSSSLLRRSPESTQNGANNNNNHNIKHQQDIPISNMSAIKEEEFRLQEELIQVKEENSQLTQEIALMKKQLYEQSQKHKQDIQRLEKLKDEERQRNLTHTNQLEKYIQEMLKENKKHELEVEKALKIHRVNETLSQKNDELKNQVEKLKEDIKNVITNKNVEILSLSEKLMQTQQEIQKRVTAFKEDICKNCLQSQQDKEEQFLLIEDLKRQIEKLKKNSDGLMLLSSKNSTDLLSETAKQSNKDFNQKKEDQSIILITQLEKDFKVKIDKYVQDIKSKDEIIQDLSEKIMVMKEKEGQLEGKMTELKKDFDKQTKKQTDMAQQIEQLTMVINKDALQIMEFREKSAKLEKDLSDLQQKLTQREKYILTLEEEIDNIDNNKKGSSQNNKGKK